MKLFLSYRRDDTAYQTGELQKRLAAAEAHFKAEQKRAAEAAAQLADDAKLVQAELAKLHELVG